MEHKKLIVFLGNDYDQHDHADLFPEIQKLGMDVIRIHPYDIETLFDTPKTKFYYKGELLQPDLVIGWVYEEILLPGMYLLEAFERAGIPVINQARVLFCAQNKYLISSMLHAAGVPHLKVLSGRNKQVLHQRAREIGFPLVMKPIVGFGGIGLQKFDSQEELDAYLLNNAGEFYVQPFVRNPGRDIRVLCINFQAVVAFHRYAPDTGWVTNTIAGGKPVMTQLTPELAAIAEDASKAAGTLISGVDVVEDLNSNGYRIFEVNSCPSAQPSFEIMKRKPVFLYKLADFLVSAAQNFDQARATWRPSSS